MKILISELPNFSGQSMKDNLLNEIFSFEHLYKSYKLARRAKRHTRPVIDFELHLSENLADLEKRLQNGSYVPKGYYKFLVYEPKLREINALHFSDRVVQHCFCDYYLGPLLDKKLIYDNAACRTGKGTHFAMNRLDLFLHRAYKEYKGEVWALKGDIHKFFDSINHDVLLKKMEKTVKDKTMRRLIKLYISGFKNERGTGIPLGNQTSQWFALYYLDDLDRLIKEKLRIKYYTRYMDDFVILGQSKEELQNKLKTIREYVTNALKLDLNEKTQIFPIKNGVDYLGFHFYLTDTGKVIRKVRKDSKERFKRKLRYLMEKYARGEISLPEVKCVFTSHIAHLKHGNTWKLRKKNLRSFRLTHFSTISNTLSNTSRG